MRACFDTASTVPTGKLTRVTSQFGNTCDLDSLPSAHYVCCLMRLNSIANSGPCQVLEELHLSTWCSNRGQAALSRQRLLGSGTIDGRCHVSQVRSAPSLIPTCRAYLGLA